MACKTSQGIGRRAMNNDGRKNIDVDRELKNSRKRRCF